MTSDMWRVIFYERVGGRLHTDRTGPWLPSKQMAQNWANWFGALGYQVALQNQGGELHRISIGLPS